MLNHQARILNFDNSVSRQDKLLGQFQPHIVGLEKLAPYARLWLNKKTETKIKSLFSPELRNAPTFLGSGDFHHISSLLIDQYLEPVSVIIFDNHPDWDTLPPKTGCGSWVSRILKKPNVRKVISLGIASDDISDFNIQTGNLTALRNTRLEIYPYEHASTRVLLREVPENPSIKTKKGIFSTRIYWQELKGKDLAGFARELAARLEAKQVYISIDKDCLQAEYSLTNWEEGRMRLEDLLVILKILKENTDIVGLDITGDYSEINIQGGIKSFCSRLDHPNDFSAKNKPDSLIASVNEETNIKLLNVMGAAPAIRALSSPF